MRNVYLPVEVKGRAWTAKLMLAIQLANEGYNVLIGSSKIVLEYAKNDHDGVYIEKDFYHLRSTEMRKLKERGFLLYALDEEGLVQSDDDLYIQCRTDKETVELCNMVFTWGKKDYKLLRETYPKANIKAVGNPRIDLITNANMEQVYKEELKKIRTIGNYILFNSNFTDYGSPALSARRSVNIDERHSNNKNLDRYYDLYLEYYQYSDDTFDSLIKAITLLAENIDDTLILRAHPVEDLSKWNTLLKLKNVKVVYKFDANPWIYAAKAVIQHNCTTGIEAYLHKKTVFAYKPFDYPHQASNDLPNQISILATSPEELLEKVNSNLNIKEYHSENEELLNSQVHLNEMNGEANKLIIQQIQKDSENMKETISNKFKNSIKWDGLDLIYILNEFRKKPGRSFPYESRMEFSRRLNNICDGIKIKNIKYIHVDRNLFLVKRLD